MSSLTNTIQENEQNIIEAAKDRLAKFGEVTLEPITSSLNPYSSRQFPDLVFTPKFGPNIGTTYIVEFKHANSMLLPSVIVSNAKSYKHQLEQGNPRIKIKYALSSNGEIVEENLDEEIELFGKINSADSLIEEIKQWTGIEEPVTSADLKEQVTEPASL
jgi:hypothetical protein